MTLPFGLTGGLAAVLAVALLAAAYVRGYSGFGFSAIFIAFAALFINPVPLIPVVFMCEIAMTAFQARGIRPHIDWPRALMLLAGAALATIPSIYVMARLSEDTARLTISTLILALSLLLLSGWRLKRPIGRAGHVGVGVASGMANSAGVGGLPVAAFMAAQPIPAATFRATMVAYLTGIDVMAMPVMWANGLVHMGTLFAAALAFPILGLGVWLGGRQFLSASPQQFRRVAVTLLLFLSLIGIARAVMA